MLQQLACLQPEEVRACVRTCFADDSDSGGDDSEDDGGDDDDNDHDASGVSDGSRGGGGGGGGGGNGGNYDTDGGRSLRRSAGAKARCEWGPLFSTAVVEPLRVPLRDYVEGASRRFFFL